jgi:hypothetical protein
MSRSLEKRLARVEQTLADMPEQEKAASCNCYPRPKFGPWIVALTAEGFEAEANLPCPVHGFRRLGKLLIPRIFGAKGALAESYARRDEAVKAYSRRLSEFLRSHPELKDDRDEL